MVPQVPFLTATDDTLIHEMIWAGYQELRYIRNDNGRTIESLLSRAGENGCQIITHPPLPTREDILTCLEQADPTNSFLLRGEDYDENGRDDQAALHGCRMAYNGLPAAVRMDHDLPPNQGNSRGNLVLAYKIPLPGDGIQDVHDN